MHEGECILKYLLTILMQLQNNYISRAYACCQRRFVKDAVEWTCSATIKNYFCVVNITSNSQHVGVWNAGKIPCSEEFLSAQLNPHLAASKEADSPSSKGRTYRFQPTVAENFFLNCVLPSVNDVMIWCCGATGFWDYDPLEGSRSMLSLNKTLHFVK